MLKFYERVRLFLHLRIRNLPKFLDYHIDSPMQNLTNVLSMLISAPSIDFNSFLKYFIPKINDTNQNLYL